MTCHSSVMGWEILVSVLCIVVLQVYGQSCPSGWVDGPSGKKCYFFAYNHHRTWTDAQYACHSMRSQLLSIEDITELRWLQQEFKQIKTKNQGPMEWWTSLQKREANGTAWYWESGGQLNTSFVRWGQGEPNNYKNNEHCAEICCPHYLNDINCESKIGYVCEFDKATSPLTCDADDGWEYHNGSCYKFVPKFKTWNDSISDCEFMDSNLAAATDWPTFSAVSLISNYRQTDTWIGVYRNEKVYYLTDSSVTTGVDEFIKPLRNKDGMACMSINSTVKYPLRSIYPDDCTNNKQFICQKPEGICGDGLLQHQSMCYYISASKQRKMYADIICRTKGMILVEITSASKSSYLISILKDRDDTDQIWIGLTKKNNNWFWKSTGEIPKLNHWTYMSPENNATLYDCGYMDVMNDGHWNKDFSCNKKLKFVCESPAKTSLTTVAPTTTTPTTTTTVKQTTPGTTTTISTTLGTTLSSCQTALCDELYQRGKDMSDRGNSPVMEQAAKAFYESTICIVLRTTYNCLIKQPKHCTHILQSFGYKHQMNQKKCSTNPIAAVFDPKTMVSECRMTQSGKNYTGTVSITKSGRTCQAWITTYPHKHSYSRTLGNQKNYCRNPDNEPYGPWCYTTDVNQRWEYCDIPYCIGAAIPLTTTTTTTMATTTTESKTWSEKCGMFWEDTKIKDVCYHFGYELVDWMTARTKCDDLGGSLISITSLNEQYYLAGAIKKSKISPYWIGANSRGGNEGWRWSDGSPFSLLHWMPDQPNGADENEECAAIVTTVGQWEDKQCSEKLGFICRKSVASPEPPPIPPESPRVGEDQMYGCPEGWFTYQSNCYLIARNKTNWKGARSACRKEDADLVSINGEGEQDFLTSQIPSKMCFNVHSSDTKCDEWAQKGECSKNPVWMSKNCHLSCNMCMRDCKNLHISNECDFWAKVGECSKNPTYMLKNCAFSCGICDGGVYGGFWTGLNDHNYQMSFEWSDDSKVTYTKWAKNEPNNWNGQTREDCVIMLLKNGYWNDANCNMVQPGYICEKRKQIIDKVTESPLSVGCVNDSIGYDAYCYGIYDETADWQTAEIMCSQVQYGHLATVNDRFIHLFLASQLVGKSGSYWIGLQQDYDTGLIESWSSGLPVQYTAWSRDHTGNIDEDGMCVSMGTSHPVGAWDTKNCSLEMSYICEYPREGFTTSTTTTTTVLPPTCPKYWKELENYCYKLFTQKLSWTKSRDYCRDRGADLISLHSYPEANFLRADVMKYFYGVVWIGLNDRDSENGFKWSDGSPFDFGNWSPNEPNDRYSNEDCVYASKYGSGQWNDAHCSNSYGFVCKIMKGMPLIEPNVTITEEYCDTEKKWRYYKDFCYLMNKMYSRTFKQAEADCNEMQSHLISYHSQDEHDWVNENILQKFNSWIGLNRLSKAKDGYSWTDSSPVDFLHWTDARRSTTDRCVQISGESARWFTISCFYKVSNYICKKSNSTAYVGTTPEPNIQGGCMPGFIRSTFNSKCYKVFEVKKTWNGAKKSCSAFGKSFSLVAIESEQEQLFITSMISSVKEKVWIGLTDIHSYSRYYWDDGTPLTYTNWNVKEPNGYREHCGDIFVEREKFGEWNDERCSHSLYFMCQGLQNPHLPIEADNDGCVPGYTKYQYSSTDFTCFKFVETSKTWNASRLTCLQEGGDLASIRSIPEHSFIKYLTYNKTTSSIWIGLSSLDSKDGITYQWSNGWPLMYAKFDPDNLPNKPCISMGRSFWNDQDCQTELPFVCKIEAVKPPSRSDSKTCKENGYLNNDRCFYPFLHNPLTWSAARDECLKLGLTLTSLKNVEEISFLLKLINKLAGLNPKIWIGLNKLNKNVYSWSWVDETPYSFNNWNSGEPSTSWRDQSEECVEMRPDGTWNDINCFSYSRPFICGGDQVIATTPSTTMPTTTIAVETTNQTQSSASMTTTIKDWEVNQKKEELKSKEKVSNSSSLTVGQIIGILIGIMGCIVILSAILFIIRFNKQKGNYKASSFVNALYLKTTEEVNVEDNTAMGSTVKICGSDT